MSESVARAPGASGPANAPATNLQMDKRIDMFMGMLLRTGVLVAATLVLVGGVVFLARHRVPVTNYRVFQGEPAELRTLGGIVRDAFAWHGRGLIQLGLLLLIATPVARVTFSVGAFFYERDSRYVAVSLVLLALLFCSLFSGHG